MLVCGAWHVTWSVRCSRHNLAQSGWLGGGTLERCSQALGGTTISRERGREGRRVSWVAVCGAGADCPRVTQLVREADDDGDWQAAGCSSSAPWLAHLLSSDHRTAVRISRPATRCVSCPRSTRARPGALTLDQVAAAAEFATPASDAELARVAVGRRRADRPVAVGSCRPPSRTTTRSMRGGRCGWRGRRGRELAFSGCCRSSRVSSSSRRSGIRQGAACRRQAGRDILDWQQSAADALVSLATRDRFAPTVATARSPTTLIVHVSEARRRCSKAPGRSAPRPPRD